MIRDGSSQSVLSTNIVYTASAIVYINSYYLNSSTYSTILTHLFGWSYLALYLTEVSA